MGFHSHLSEHCLPGVMAALIAALMHLDQKKFRSLIPSCHRFIPEVVVGGKWGCVSVVAVCLSLTWPLVAFSQEIDEGEFSRTMLGYKLQLLRSQFEQTEMRLLTPCLAASNAKRLEHVYNEIKRRETEFRCGEYYPDLLDEQIAIIREELRLILANPVKTTSM